MSERNNATSAEGMPADCEAPSVSIVVPVYKVRDYILPCVRSIYAQTLQEPFEVIYVDDADPDASLQLLEGIAAEKPARITERIIKHDRNRGLSAARNTGTDAARADYVFYVDSDDLITPTALEGLLRDARTHGADVTSGRTHMMQEEYGKEYFDHICGPMGGMEALAAYLGWKVRCSAWNKMLRRSFLCGHGIRFNEGMLHEDEMWQVDLFLAGATCYGSEVVSYEYRNKREGSIMAISRLERTAAVFAFMNVNADTLVRHGLGDMPEGRTFFPLTVEYLIRSLLRAARADGRKAVWNVCARTAATMATGIRPALRGYLTAGKWAKPRMVGRISRIPGAWLRKALLFCFLYLLSFKH